MSQCKSDLKKFWKERRAHFGISRCSIVQNMSPMWVILITKRWIKTPIRYWKHNTFISKCLFLVFDQTFGRNDPIKKQNKYFFPLLTCILVIPLFNIDEKFHWIKIMLKNQRPTPSLLLRFQKDKKCQNPTKNLIVTIHLSFPSLQTPNKTWDFFFLFLFVTNKNKRWSFTCRGGWCHHTAKTDKINY